MNLTSPGHKDALVPVNDAMLVVDSNVMIMNSDFNAGCGGARQSACTGIYMRMYGPSPLALPGISPLSTLG